MSLARLISDCGYTVTHERRPILPWIPDYDMLEDKISFLENGEGDVAFYYLPYVEYVFRRIPDIRMICLKRNKQDTVASYKWRLDTMGKHHFINDDHDPWDKCYPTTGIRNKIEALEDFWDMYYERAHRLEKKYDNFRVYDMEDINDIGGQRDILHFAGVPPEQHNVQHVKENAHEPGYRRRQNF